MPIYNTYAILMEKKLSVVSFYLVDKDFDNPLENPDEKGLAFAGMLLCFTFRLSWNLASFPSQAF